MSEWCPPEQMLEEIYVPGTEPTELCDLHGPGLFGTPLRGLPQVLPDTGSRADTTEMDSLSGAAAGVAPPASRRP